MYVRMFNTLVLAHACLRFELCRSKKVTRVNASLAQSRSDEFVCLTFEWMHIEIVCHKNGYCCIIIPPQKDAGVLRCCVVEYHNNLPEKIIGSSVNALIQVSWQNTYTHIYSGYLKFKIDYNRLCKMLISWQRSLKSPPRFFHACSMSFLRVSM